MCLGNTPISAEYCSDTPWLSQNEYEEPERCEYCEEEGELFEMKYSYKGRKYKEWVCKDCLLETIKEDGSLKNYSNGLLIQKQIL